MTFSIESDSKSERTSRQGMVLRSKIISPAVFLGFMATVAAHRAIFRGYHKDLAPSEINHDDLITDPDYKRVKHEAIIAVRQMIQDRQDPDQYLIDACFGLVSIATVVGNFEEAKVHLQGIARMVSLVGISAEAMPWLPVANVKVSTAMLALPPLPIPWQREPIPHDILQKIKPPPDSERCRLGTNFKMIQLSEGLQQLLLAHRDICSLCEFNTQNPGKISTLENVVFNQKATELEWDYVAYAYKPTVFPQNETKGPTIPPLEAVVRLAGLGLLSTTPHTIMPSSGSGRAITDHQKRAIERLLRDRDRQLDTYKLQAIMWALFVFIERSKFQPEETYFTEKLSLLLEELGLFNWQQVEAVLFGFLYIPQVQRKGWKANYAAAVHMQLQLQIPQYYHNEWIVESGNIPRKV